MALDIGSRLGHYDVTALIGEGDGTGLKPSVASCPTRRCLVHNSRSRSILALHPEIRGPA